MVQVSVDLIREIVFRSIVYRLINKVDIAKFKAKPVLT